jgi:diaminopimelate epimerase
MKVQFEKYQGTGNDFIMVDNRSGNFSLSVKQITHLCNRKFGIGSDGVILIEETGFGDFYMNFYNPDGSQSFCGNGSRCAVKFAQSLGLANLNGEFKAIDTNHDFETNGAEVRIRMKNVLEVRNEGKDFIIQTGSPHYIIYRDDFETLDIINEARAIRYNERFKEVGINVNFVSERNGELFMRTYERGVEDETLSCGTGVTAAALSFAYIHSGLNSLKVNTKGGQLEVKFKSTDEGGFENVWLCGPAEFVFSGEINLNDEIV